jgi:hypothetical protein
MLELTGVASILRGVSALYWLLAIGALVLVIWKIKRWPYKAIGIAIVVALFGYLPVTNWIEARQRQAYATEAWTYFKKKCDTEAGEKIYKTFTGVKSVVVIKPLPPATEKDLFDQFWYGDPYSNATPWSKRGESAATALVLDSRRPSGIQRGLEFVEINNESGHGYTRITRPTSPDKSADRENIETPVSRFGVSWEDISTPEDRKFWVAGSRLRVIDLTDNSIVAERVGYFIEAGFGSLAGQRRPWLTSRGPNTTCPPLFGGDYSDNWFLTSVFKQGGEK